MSWLGLVAIIIGGYLAFKVVSFVLKVVLWLVVLGGAYYVIAPMASWPPLHEVFHVLGS